MHVLIVCTGNTCRSPMTAALLERGLEADGPPGVSVSSAGTGAIEGAPVSEGAYLVALEAGLDLSAHRAQLLTPKLVQEADLILTMSRSHLTRVEELGGSDKVVLLGEYATGGKGDEEIWDPYGSGVPIYRETLRHLIRLVEATRRQLMTAVNDDRR